MKKETRQIAGPGVTLEQRADGQPPAIVGYGSVFYDPADPGTEYDLRSSWGGFVERIMPGAFDRAIREDDVRALFNHDANHVLGRTPGTLKLSADSKGLRYEISPPDTQTGRDVTASIQRGDISGSSFSFSVEEESWHETRDATTGQTTVIREIRAVRLYDVGPVTFPAYQSATAGVRSENDLAEARVKLEEFRAKQRAKTEAVAIRARLVSLGLL
jgi:HK97 family phage prohead protease